MFSFLRKGHRKKASNKPPKDCSQSKTNGSAPDEEPESDDSVDHKFQFVDLGDDVLVTTFSYFTLAKMCKFRRISKLFKKLFTKAITLLERVDIEKPRHWYHISQELMQNSPRITLFKVWNARIWSFDIFKSLLLDVFRQHKVVHLDLHGVNRKIASAVCDFPSKISVQGLQDVDTNVFDSVEQLAKSNTPTLQYLEIAAHFWKTATLCSNLRSLTLFSSALNIRELEEIAFSCKKITTLRLINIGLAADERVNFQCFQALRKLCLKPPHSPRPPSAPRMLPDGYITGKLANCANLTDLSLQGRWFLTEFDGVLISGVKTLRRLETYFFRQIYVNVILKGCHDLEELVFTKADGSDILKTFSWAAENSVVVTRLWKLEVCYLNCECDEDTSDFVRRISAGGCDDDVVSVAPRMELYSTELVNCVEKRG